MSVFLGIFPITGTGYSSSICCIFRFCLYLRMIYMIRGIIVSRSIVNKALSPVIRIFIVAFNPSTLSVTRVKDSANDRTSLSIWLICLNKTRVQAKPGAKKTRMIPRITLITGTLSRTGTAQLNNSLIGLNIAMVPA